MRATDRFFAVPLHAVALAAALLLSRPAMAQSATPAVPRVGTVLAARRPVAQAREFVGRVEAAQRVDVRARVTGYLDAVLFKEGETVKEGTPLLRIEQAPFQTAVQQAQGALLRAQAAFANARLQRQRADDLVKTSATSVAERDRRLADEQAAQGDVVTALANLQTAQINLGYTEIAAPITGLIGRMRLTRGNVVGPDAGVLTSLVSQDPMYVTFPVSQREFLQIEGDRSKLGDDLTVKLVFSDGTVYGQTGKLNFIDVSVDRATDTVIVRATIANPNGTLIDGQLVRVRVEESNPTTRVLVPQSALIADQQGVYVFVVESGRAAVRRIKPAGDVGGDIVVEDGLRGGEQVIAEGMESIRPGATVTATPLPPSPGQG